VKLQVHWLAGNVATDGIPAIRNLQRSAQFAREPTGQAPVPGQRIDFMTNSLKHRQTRCEQQLRNPMLYPFELRARVAFDSTTLPAVTHDITTYTEAL
jgi:hypothetical protein